MVENGAVNRGYQRTKSVRYGKHNGILEQKLNDKVAGIWRDSADQRGVSKEAQHHTLVNWMEGGCALIISWEDWLELREEFYCIPKEAYSV